MMRPSDKPFVLDPDSRVDEVERPAILTSSWVVGLFVILTLAATADWVLFWLLKSTSTNLLGMSVLLSGGSLGTALVLIYGWTGAMGEQVPLTTAQVLERRKRGLQVNIADAVDRELLALLTDHMDSAEQQQGMQAFLADVFSDSNTKVVLQRLGFEDRSIRKEIELRVLPHVSWMTIGQRALKMAIQRNRDYIGVLDVVGALLTHENMHDVLRAAGLQEDDVQFAVWWEHVRSDVAKADQRWWDKEALLNFTGIGMSWAAGYTPLVDQFVRIPQGNMWDVPYGHAPQVDAAIKALARQRQSNVLLVGKPGVGRLGVAKEIARRVRAGRAHPELHGRRVLYIHLSELLGLGTNVAQQRSIITQALREMERAGNIIAIIDGVSGLLGDPEDASFTDALLPFFSSEHVRTVVIMSLDDFHLRIQSNDELMKYFEVVHIPPLSEELTLQLLALVTPEWERRAQVFFPYRTLEEIVHATSTVLPYIPFPEKAFDVLEEAVAAAQASNVSGGASLGLRTITPEAARYLISQKVGVDVTRMTAQEGSRLLGLEDIIHRRIVNQERAVAAIARAMIRSRARVRSEKRPIGTFLFLGPTGVGKTETAKALAEAYFGSEGYMQRIDMSEFSGPDGVERLLGGAQNPTGRLTKIVSVHPFTVLLLDEFEKASRQVQQVFLPILDEGYATDSTGNRFSFTHTIIIATSNAGAEFIREQVGQDGTVPQDFDLVLREYILKNDIFLPELLNRFDDVTTFTPLTQQHIREIAERMLRVLNKRLDTEHGATVAITSQLLDALVEKGYDPEFGARPMTRAIQNIVEYAVAKRLAQGTVTPGQEITIDAAAMLQQAGH